MDFNGKLEEFSASDILESLHSSGKSGTLNLHSKAGEAVNLNFHRGQILSARKKDMPSLGQILLNSGHIDRQQLQAALAQQQQSKKRRLLGLILQDLQFAKRQHVRKAIIKQIEAVLSHLTNWQDGSFHFEANDSIEPADEGFSVNDLIMPEEMNREYTLLEAIRRFDEDRQSSINKPQAALPSPQQAETKVTISEIEIDSPANAILIVATSGQLPISGWCKQLKLPEIETLTNILIEDIPQIVLQNKRDSFVPLVVLPFAANFSTARAQELCQIVLGIAPEAEIFVLVAAQDFNQACLLYDCGVRTIIPYSPDSPLEEAEQLTKNALLSAINRAAEDIKNFCILKRDGQNINCQSRQAGKMLQAASESAKSETVLLDFLKLLSCYFRRCLIFLMRDQTLKGIGGFDCSLTQFKINQQAKQLRLMLQQDDCLVKNCLDQRQSYLGKLPNQQWLGSLFQQIAPPINKAGLILPVYGMSQLACLIYADNGNFDLQIKQRSMLDVFAGQTGLILENLYLRKKLNRLD